MLTTNPSGVAALQPGEGSPSKLGEFYLIWDSNLGISYLETKVNLAASGANPWGSYDGSTPNAHPASSMYVAPGLDLHYVSFETANLSVFGNGIPIANSDHTPGLFDHTDFGTVAPGDSAERTFTLSCDGFCPIYVAAPDLTGPYSFVGDFPEYVEDLATFTIALNPLAPPGHHFGTITFANDSSNASSYSYSFTAFVIPEPTSVSPCALALLDVFWLGRRHDR